MRIAIIVAAFALLPMLGSAQERTLPTDASVVALPSVIGKGVQIYRCQQQPAGAAWVLVAPHANLYGAPYSDGSEALGTHFAGPTWRWQDGSAVVGKMMEKQPAPDGVSVPWLLLSATPAADSTPGGVLDGVVFVRRSDTQGGGMPTQGCDAAHMGAEAQVPYTATYTFYKHKPSP